MSETLTKLHNLSKSDQVFELSSVGSHRRAASGSRTKALWKWNHD